MTLTPRFKFGPITGVENVSFSLSRGITPSVCLVQMPLNTSIANYRQPMEMSFSDGVRTVRFRDCLIVDISPSVDGEGFQTMDIAIHDRRWKWRYGAISGTYNIRTGGALQFGTKKNARELAELCLKEMGETRDSYDVSRMPVDEGVFPHVDWQVQNPAAALDALCQSLNCHIVLGVDDRVYIFRDGDGKDMPNIPSSSSGVGFDFGTLPGELAIASAPMRWQFDFVLTPVGLDADNQIKPIDQLSYKPRDFEDDNGVMRNGWTAGDPVTMSHIRANRRKLARETVFRWFSITLPEAGSRMPTTTEEIVSIQQFFLLDHQLEYEELKEIDKVAEASEAYDRTTRKRLPAQVWGLFQKEDGTGQDNVKNFVIKGYVDLNKKQLNLNGSEQLVYKDLIYNKSWQIDSERRIVMFGDPVYRVVESRVASPVLLLRAACNFHNARTRAPYRKIRRRKLKNAPDPKLSHWDVRDDLVPEWRETSSSASVDNIKSEVDPQADYYLNYALAKYQAKIPAHMEIPILFPFSPDGRIAQVTFYIDGEGFIGTTINKELENLLTPVAYRERQFQVQVAQIIKHYEELARTQDEQVRGKQ